MFFAVVFSVSPGAQYQPGSDPFGEYGLPNGDFVGEDSRLLQWEAA